MSDTVAVLALDAADFRLARRWDCDNILLDDHRELETFSHSLSFPRTVEVWPTVATGLPPQEHGNSGDSNDWVNPVLKGLSTVSQYLPRRTRSILGQPFRRLGQEKTIRQIDVDHVFDNGAVRYWPGLTEADHLLDAWKLTSALSSGESTEREVERTLKSFTGEEFGWLAVASQFDVPVVGVHSHVLDIAGHVYCNREKELRRMYEWVDVEIGRLRQRVGRLILLSDHGMQVNFLDDSDPGTHSFDALIAAQGLPKPLPDSVYDVREYIETNATTPQETDDEDGTLDTPTEHLEALGYIE